MNLKTTRIDRREFLRNAGAGSLSLAMLPALRLNSDDDDDDDDDDDEQITHFRFISVSTAGVVAGVNHFAVMSGQGLITTEDDDDDDDEIEVEGGGSFVHFNNDPAIPAPKPILGSGHWEIESLVSFETIGSFGVNIAGTLVVDIRLHEESGLTIPARLTVNCNVPPGGLFTGLAEGYYLSVAGLPEFEPAQLPVAGGGPPPALSLGATIFSSV